MHKGLMAKMISVGAPNQQFIEQWPCFLQIARAKALGEPAVDQSEKLASTPPACPDRAFAGGDVAACDAIPKAQLSCVPDGSVSSEQDLDRFVGRAHRKSVKD